MITGPARGAPSSGEKCLRIAVGHDAAVCLDLILRDVGVDCRELRRVRNGAHATIALNEIDDGHRIIAVLRQHLGTQLRDAVLHEHS